MLTVGANKVEESKEPEVPPMDNNPGPPETKLASGDLLTAVPVKKIDRNDYKPAKPIPPSLPDSFNEQYNNSSKKRKMTMRIDLGEAPKSEFYYVNDIIMTDVEVRSEVDLKLAEIEKLRCAPGRILKEISFNGNLLDQYDIYERLGGFESSGVNRSGDQSGAQAKVIPRLRVGLT